MNIFPEENSTWSYVVCCLGWLLFAPILAIIVVATAKQPPATSTTSKSQPAT